MTAQVLAADILRAHAARQRRRVLALVLMGVVLAACLVADVALGSTHFAFGEILRAVFTPASAEPETAIIVWSLRLPYALLAVLVGAALSLAGAEMQTVLDNPLADPFTLGVSSAASLGAALAIVTGLHLPGVPAEWSLAANTFFFAFASVLLLQAITRRGRQTMVLFGISMVFTFNALVALLQYAANPEDLQQLVFWSMGSLALANWPKLQVLGVALLAMLPFSLRAAARLNVLRMGEERARTLGIDTGRLRFGALLRISLLAATAVAFVGTIGFVGLVGPHIARMLIGEDHRHFLPASALVGGVLMSLASIASKALVPGVVLPVGIVTAMVGVPVFLWLIMRRSARA
ncbi:ABC transporter inner membrane permease [Bordetella ansorpii]|uniref:ABC transporter inner membrane permease n=1 Tax=Bordetella ansorpii TaxID=288768 RepID=A0A157NKQ9_9BORD|nr:iron ABC transporter permease [Bordetella ansorpii]SAI21289.1 ABC transporter inner membrane permease [Bordetella ansorpii]